MPKIPGKFVLASVPNRSAAILALLTWQAPFNTSLYTAKPHRESAFAPRKGVLLRSESRQSNARTDSQAWKRRYTGN
jgi:hypothetical protein